MTPAAFEIIRSGVSSVVPTTGELLIEGLHFCWTLELPWLDNLPGNSCIPVGTYRVTFPLSTRYRRNMPRLVDVPGRSGILIHPGNTPHDTQGCILVGNALANGTVLKSRDAFGHFLEWFASVGNETWVTIRNAPMEVAYAA